MGRIKPKYNNPLYARTRSNARREVKAAVSVGQSRHRVAGEEFYACARIGGTMSCAHGKNPRVAVGKALRAVAADVVKRKGAFAGYSKSKRRR